MRKSIAYILIVLILITILPLNTYKIEAAEGVGEKVFIPEYSRGSVAVFYTSDKAIRSHINVGKAPNSVAYGTDGLLYVTCRDSKTISVINPATEKVVKTINVSSFGKVYGTIATKDNKIYFCGTNKIGCYNITNDSISLVTNTIGDAYNLVVYKYSLYFVIKRNQNLFCYNLKTGVMEERIIPNSSEMYSVSLSPDGKYIAISDKSEGVFLYNILTDSVEQIYKISCYSSEFSNNQKYLYFTDTKDYLNRYNLETKKLDRIKLNGSVNYSLGILSENIAIVMSYSSSCTYIIDLSTFTQQNTIQVLNPYYAGNYVTSYSANRYKGTPKDYVLTFDANGGSLTENTKTITEDETYGTLPTPQRTNYIFQGWFSSESGGNEITDTASLIVNSNHTIYAHWLPDVDKIKAARLGTLNIHIAEAIEILKTLSITTTDKNQYTDNVEATRTQITDLSSVEEIDEILETAISYIYDEVNAAEVVNNSNIEAAADITELISAIGTVSYDNTCKGKIDTAKNEYNEASSFVKSLIFQDVYNTLIEAEAVYIELKTEAENYILYVNETKSNKLEELNSYIDETLETLDLLSISNDSRAQYIENIEATINLISELTAVDEIDEILQTAIGIVNTEAASAEAESEANIKVTDILEIINAIGTVYYSESCKELIDTARNAYDVASNRVKELIPEVESNKINLAETRYEELKTEAENYIIYFNTTKANSLAELNSHIDEAIEQLEELVITTDEKNEYIEAIEATRDSITELTSVDGIVEILQMAIDSIEASISEAETVSNSNNQKAVDIREHIDAIGIVTYTDTCKENITSAKQAYDSASDIVKSLITQAEYNKIEAARDRYIELKKEADHLLIISSKKASPMILHDITLIAAPIVTPIAAPIVTPIAAPIVTPIAAPIVTPIVTPITAPVVEPKVITPGTITSNIKKDEAAPDTALINSISNLQSIVLDEDDISGIQSGKHAKIYLEVNNAEDTVSEADKVLIESKLDKHEKGIYLDISLWKKIGDAEAEKVTNTKGNIKICIKIPDELINSQSPDIRQYKIIRIHDGVASIIEGTYDSDTQMFTFETDRFSTYTLAYMDVDIDTPVVTKEEPINTPVQKIIQGSKDVSAEDKKNNSLIILLIMGSAVVFTVVRRKKLDRR